MSFIFFIKLGIYLLVQAYIFIRIYKMLSDEVDESTVDFEFPSGEYLLFKHDNKEYYFEIVSRASIESSPTLMARAYIDKQATYVFFFGEDVSHKDNFIEIDKPREHSFEDITVDEARITYFDGADFVKVDDDEEARVMLKVAQESNEEGSYSYNYKDEKLSTQKLTTNIFTFFGRFVEEFSNNNFKIWHIIFLIFFLILSINVFDNEPILFEVGSQKIGRVTLGIYAFISALVYLSFYFILQKKYIKLVFTPLYAFLLTFLILPSFYIGYATAFEVLKQPLNIVLHGYRLPYLKYTDKATSGTYKDYYGWFNLSVDGEHNFELREKYVLVPHKLISSELRLKDEEHIESAIRSLGLSMQITGEGSPCTVRPCKVITPNNRYQTVKINGNIAFGNFVPTDLVVLQSVFKKVPTDTFTSMEMKKKTPIITNGFMAYRCYYAKRSADGSIKGEYGLFFNAISNPAIERNAPSPYKESQVLKDDIILKGRYNELMKYTKDIEDKFLKFAKNISKEHEDYGIEALEGEFIYVFSTPNDYMVVATLRETNAEVLDIKIDDFAHQKCSIKNNSKRQLVDIEFNEN